MNLVLNTLVLVGSSPSIAPGVWHFFVPRAWDWYAHTDTHVTELAAAVRAIHAFISLSLALFGVMNTLLIYGDRSNRYSIIVMFAATCVLWPTRVAIQVVFPQGTLSPGLKYGVLLAIVIVTLRYAIPLGSVLIHRTPV